MKPPAPRQALEEEPRTAVAARTANGARPSARRTSSLGRLLEILDLFTPETPIWLAEDLCRYIGSSRSNSYRYIKALSDAGLIGAVANGSYILGPRIIELDRQIRECDPMYNAGGPVMRAFVEATGHSVLLNALYRDSVVCIREALAADAPAGLFSRGQRRPLVAGTTSRIILAYLPAHQLRRVYANNKEAIAHAGLGADWSLFRAALAVIRRTGYLVSINEFNPGIVGIAAPIFNRSRNILGSFSIAALDHRIDRDRIANTAVLVTAAAQRITDDLVLTGAQLDRPPRGVG